MPNLELVKTKYHNLFFYLNQFPSIDAFCLEKQGDVTKENLKTELIFEVLLKNFLPYFYSKFAKQNLWFDL